METKNLSSSSTKLDQFPLKFQLEAQKPASSQKPKLKQRPVYEKYSPLNSPFHHRCHQQACLSLYYFLDDLIPATHQN